MPLVPPYIEALRPYEPGRSIEEVRREFGLSRIIKLASNENPLGPSPLAMERMRRATGSLNLYPNGGLDLRRELARQYDVTVDNVIAGSGSEGIMSNIIRAFLGDEDEVLTTESAFIGFQVLARSRGVRYRTVPYSEWHYDLTALATAINERTKIIYLANPNNPTGTIFTKHEFDRFYAHVPERVLIILDEAYFEYAKDNPRYPDSMHYRYDNVITLRTFSKVYGLAALRVGYAIASPEVANGLDRVRNIFNVNQPAQEAALASLHETEAVARRIRHTRKAREELYDTLASAGLDPIRSHANFVYADVPGGDGDGLADRLLHAGFIVRALRGFGAPGAIRVTVGTDDEMRLFAAAIQDAEISRL
jgi:histidinol-phosphate aminotransferase